MRKIPLGNEAHRLGQDFDGRDHARKEIVGDAAKKGKRREADGEKRIGHLRHRSKRFRSRHFDDDVPARRADRLSSIELLHAVKFSLEHFGLIGSEACGKILVLAILHLSKRRIIRRELLVIDELAVRPQHEK